MRTARVGSALDRSTAIRRARVPSGVEFRAQDKERGSPTVARNGHRYIYRPTLYGKPMTFRWWRIGLARIVALLSVGAGLRYLHWRLSTVAGTGSLGIALLAIEAVNVAGLIVTTVLFWRAVWRSGPKAPPSGTLDILVTVCGEPVEMAERTLKAALAISPPNLPAQRWLDRRQGELEGNRGPWSPLRCPMLDSQNWVPQQGRQPELRFGKDQRRIHCHDRCRSLHHAGFCARDARLLHAEARGRRQGLREKRRRLRLHPSTVQRLPGRPPQHQRPPLLPVHAAGEGCG